VRERERERERERDDSCRIEIPQLCENKENAVRACLCGSCGDASVISLKWLASRNSPSLSSSILLYLLPAVAIRVRVAAAVAVKFANAIALCFSTASLLLLSSTLSSEGCQLTVLIILLSLFMCEEVCACGCHPGRLDQHTWECWQVSGALCGSERERTSVQYEDIFGVINRLAYIIRCSNVVLDVCVVVCFLCIWL